MSIDRRQTREIFDKFLCEKVVVELTECVDWMLKAVTGDVFSSRLDGRQVGMHRTVASQPI